MKYILLFLCFICIAIFSYNNIYSKKILNPGKSGNNNLVFQLNDSILIPKFTINLILSEKAEDSLALAKESIIVIAYLTGEPKDSLLENDDYEFGVELGRYQVELFQERKAVFDFIKIPKEKFNELNNDNFEVLINVVSGRRTNKNNILDVEIFQDLIQNIQFKEFTLKGKLISE